MYKKREWQELVEAHQYRWFIVGVIALGVLGNSAYDIALTVLDRGPLWFSEPWEGIFPKAFLFAVSFVVVPSLAVLLNLWSNRGKVRQAADIVGPDRKMSPKRALIAFVSSGGNAYADAIYRHRGGEHREQGRLEYCWLLHSDDEKSQKAAEGAADELMRSGISAKTVDIGDVTNVSTTLQALRRTIADAYSIDSKNPITADDLAVDMTGGQRHQGAAAVIVCANGDGLLQYMQGEYDKEGHLIKGRHAHAMYVPIEIEVNSSPSEGMDAEMPPIHDPFAPDASKSSKLERTSLTATFPTNGVQA